MLPRNESTLRECGRTPAERPVRQPLLRLCSLGSLEIIHRTDFYGSFTPFAHCWNPLAPFDRFIEVLAFEDVVPGKLFLRFGEWLVNRHRHTVLHTDRGCSRRRFETLDSEQNTLLFENIDGTNGFCMKNRAMSGRRGYIPDGAMPIPEGEGDFSLRDTLSKCKVLARSALKRVMGFIPARSSYLMSQRQLAAI